MNASGRVVSQAIAATRNAQLRWMLRNPQHEFFMHAQMALSAHLVHDVAATATPSVSNEIFQSQTSWKGEHRILSVEETFRLQAGQGNLENTLKSLSTMSGLTADDLTRPVTRFEEQPRCPAC